MLSGGNYLSAMNCCSEQPFPVALEGGLLPESAIPVSGNTVNAIDVGNGGFAAGGPVGLSLGLSYDSHSPRPICRAAISQ